LGFRRAVEIHKNDGRVNTDGDLADKAIVGMASPRTQPPPWKCIITGSTRSLFFGRMMRTRTAPLGPT
jgi:hypothetical protein